MDIPHYAIGTGLLFMHFGQSEYSSYPAGNAFPAAGPLQPDASSNRRCCNVNRQGFVVRLGGPITRRPARSGAPGGAPVPRQPPDPVTTPSTQDESAGGAPLAGPCG
jgi:hypothetical protein